MQTSVGAGRSDVLRYNPGVADVWVLNAPLIRHYLFSVGPAMGIDARRHSSSGAIRVPDELLIWQQLIPISQVNDLEQGRTQADSALLAYLTVIDEAPDTVRRALRSAG